MANFMFEKTQMTYFNNIQNLQGSQQKQESSFACYK